MNSANILRRGDPFKDGDDATSVFGLFPAHFRGKLFGDLFLDLLIEQSNCANVMIERSLS